MLSQAAIKKNTNTKCRSLLLKTKHVKINGKIKSCTDIFWTTLLSDDSLNVFKALGHATLLLVRKMSS